MPEENFKKKCKNIEKQLQAIQSLSWNAKAKLQECCWGGPREKMKGLDKD